MKLISCSRLRNCRAGQKIEKFNQINPSEVLKEAFQAASQ